MDQYYDFVLSKYKDAGLIVDTNLWLLYFVGAYDRGLVGRFSRTRNMFDPDDFDTLLRLLEKFENFILTPHILTELSNWLGYLDNPARRECRLLLKRLLETSVSEKFSSGEDLSKLDSFLFFGIADASILDVSKESYLVLTEDLPLATYLQRQGVDVLNFNQIRGITYFN